MHMHKRLIILGVIMICAALISGCASGHPLISVPLQPPPLPTEADIDLETEVIKTDGQKQPTDSALNTLEKSRAEKRKKRVRPKISSDTLFTLIYYVGISHNDHRRAVILDIEDDEIEFIPTVRDFEYEILQNVSIPEAVFEAEIFFNHEPVIYDYYFKEVRGLTGKPIGYELRPVYFEDFYGSIDPLDIKYRVKRRRVSVNIDTYKSLRVR